MREAWFSRTGLSLEQVTATYSPRQIADSLTYWRIEGEVRQASSGAAPGQADATEAAYQRARAAKARAGADPGAEHE